MLAQLCCFNYRWFCKYQPHRDAPCDSLCKAHDVRRGVPVLPSPHLARPAKARLYFVEYQHKVAPVTDLPYLWQEVVRWHYDSRLSLNRLQDHSPNCIVDGLFQLGRVAVWDELDSIQKRHE